MAKRESPSGLVGLSPGEAGGEHFFTAKRESVFPARRRKKPGFPKLFFGLHAHMYKEARPPFSEKKSLTFSPGGVMNVLAGRKAAQKAHPGGWEKPPPGERRTP